MNRKNPLIKGNVDERQGVTIPDAAIYYIVNQYLIFQQRDGSPVVKGLSSDSVETVLQLFVDWATQNGYVKDNMLVIGGTSIE